MTKSTPVGPYDLIDNRERDIVGRLRKMDIYMDGKWLHPPICKEAADEIDYLRMDIVGPLREMLNEKDAEIARLRAALEEIANWTLPTGRDAQDVARQALQSFTPEKQS